jgi:hypothetical protein
MIRMWGGITDYQCPDCKETWAQVDEWPKKHHKCEWAKIGE